MFETTLHNGENDRRSRSRFLRWLAGAAFVGVVVYGMAVRVGAIGGPDWLVKLLTGLFN